MTDERRLVVAFLVLTIAMGMLDAVSLLHFGTFTGYVTGTVILIGINLSRGAALAAPPLAALFALLLGAVAGGRLARRRHPPPRLVSDMLFGVALLIGGATVLDAMFRSAGTLGVVALLGLAMGVQTSATRHAGVADMSMPAATMVLHGLAHDSPLAGGKWERAWRRVGVLVGLLAGAALGAVFSATHVWLGLAGVAVLIAGAGALLRIAGSTGGAAS